MPAGGVFSLIIIDPIAPANCLILCCACGVITVKGLAWGRAFIIIEKDIRRWGKVQGLVEHP